MLSKSTLSLSTSLLFLLFSFYAGAQKKQQPFIVKIDGRFIFAYKDGTLALPETFDSIFDHVCYDNHLSAVTSYNEYKNLIVARNGKFGVLKNLAYVVPPVYDHILSNGCNSNFPYIGLKNKRQNFILPDGSPGKDYEKIEPAPFTNLYRITENGKQQLIYCDAPASLMDYTTKSYEKINVIADGYLILEEKGMKSMCQVSSFDTKDDFRCIPFAKCDYYFNEYDNIVQVFPGNPTANIYDSNLKMFDQNTISKKELEEEYTLFEDDINFSLTEYMSSMPLEILKALAEEEAGMPAKKPEPAKSELRDDMRKKIEYREKQPSHPTHLATKSLLVRDSVSGNKHGAVIVPRKPVRKTDIQQPPIVVPPLYDEIYADGKTYLGFIKYRVKDEYGMLDLNGKDVFGRTWKNVNQLNRQTSLIIARTADSSFVYEYITDSTRLTLLYSDKAEKDYRQDQSQLFIYPDTLKSTSPQGFISFLQKNHANPDDPRRKYPQAVVLKPEFDSIVPHPLIDNFFLTYRNNKKGFVRWDQENTLSAIYDSLQFLFLLDPKTAGRYTYEYSNGYPTQGRKFFPAVVAFKGDSVSFYRLDKEQRQTTFTRSYVACLDEGLPQLALDGSYIYTLKQDGLWEIRNEKGKLITEKRYKMVADYPEKSTGFWSIPVEDTRGKLVIDKNGVEFRLPE